MLSVIVFKVDRPGAVAALVVPIIRLPPVVVALPSTMAAVLLDSSERKSVATIVPTEILTGPVPVDAMPRMVRAPASVLVRSLPTSVPPMMLPCISVFPVPLINRLRGRLAVVPSGMVTLPVKVRLPPMLLVSVELCTVAPVAASETNVENVTP